MKPISVFKTPDFAPEYLISYFLAMKNMNWAPKRAMTQGSKEFSGENN